MVEHARGHAALVTQLLSQGNYTSANIVFPALFMTIRVHLSSVAAVFLCAVPQACCLWEQGRTTITERGSSACAWALWAVVWPDARLADGQSLTCYGPLSDYLVLVTHNRPLSLLSFFPLYGPAPHLSLMKPFPLVNSR